MSNKVIFNVDELFISVGIDVGADFSWMSIALPNQQFVGKPYKILHVWRDLASSSRILDWLFSSADLAKASIF